MIMSLRNVEARIEYAMTSKVGRAGGILTEKIGDANNYSLEYPLMAFDKSHGLTPTITYAKANGKVVSERTNDINREKPIGTAGKTPANLTDKWLTTGAREVFAGLLDKRSPFSEYVAALADPKNGYKTAVFERTLSYQGHDVKQYEIQALKLRGDPKIGGASSVSLIFDGTLHLPVTLTANHQEPGSSTPNGISMGIQWQNNVTIDKKEFEPLPSPPPQKTSH